MFNGECEMKKGEFRMKREKWQVKGKTLERGLTGSWKKLAGRISSFLRGAGDVIFKTDSIFHNTVTSRGVE